MTGQERPIPGDPCCAVQAELRGTTDDEVWCPCRRPETGQKPCPYCDEPWGGHDPDCPDAPEPTP